MVKDAYRFLIPILAFAAILFLMRMHWAALVFCLAGGMIAFFFRNPNRRIPEGRNLIVSPADGKVVRIVRLPANEGEPEGQSLSIFLSVFDVHVNRAPVAGELERLEYKRGRFKVAFDDEASRVNEQNILTIRTDISRVTVKQIAGLIARRVICWKQPGSTMKRGETIGLIRFGSRVDLEIPGRVKLHVKVGDRVYGGSSVIGEFI